MKSRGFTLIELMIVISIISILFTIGIDTYRNYNSPQLNDETKHNQGSQSNFSNNKEAR